ncbi:glycoside hydrolase family 16 protein [Nocardiopsis protaetiae]|uniref:glycoside hydrolase family 16 protein n=1 Tax=Nocardiopsis protaetiae TaxID=3382270 RepID=UPI00387AC17F
MTAGTHRTNTKKRTPLARAALPAAGLALAAGAALVLAPGTDGPAALVASQAQRALLFDDFHYTAHDDPDVSAHGWTVRSGGGGPGVPGAVWDPANVTFPNADGEPVMRLESTTDGATTEQTEVYHARKFYEGTYAARVRFTDAPVTGPDGDHVVQTFFTITPLEYPMDPDYGEADFEYLPNGGWGGQSLSMYLTTWETYNPDPWEAVNTHDVLVRSFEGWHDLVMTISGGEVVYYIDGQEVARHGEPYYPETPMSVNVNQWFIADGLTGSGEYRAYHQDVDWILHVKDEVLTPAQVAAEVDALRSAGTDFTDTIPGV